MRAAGFGAGAGEGFAAEGLDAGDGADDVAVDVEIANRQASRQIMHEAFAPRMDAAGEAVAALRDGLDHIVKAVALPADDMQNGAEGFTLP